jgi:ATP-binding cassette subfamily F protein 3
LISLIRWLEQYLRDWPRELMLITHDRAFMDIVVTHCLAIHRSKVRKIKGDTGAIYEQIVREEEVYEKTRLNDEKRVKEMEVFISRFRAKARLAGMVQSRMKMIDKMDRKDRLEKIEDLDFALLQPFEAKVYLRVENLSFGRRYTFSRLTFNLHG